METYGWVLDAKRCIECRACEAACKQWNKVETGVGVRYRTLRVSEFGVFPQIGMQALSIACNHCDNALCAKACPVKAISRREQDGAVILDTSRCLGCRMCQQFCPYQAPQFNTRTRKMEKCTMCFDRVEAGQLPACASSCPTGALRFGKWSGIAGQGETQVTNFSNPKTTSPRIRFVVGGFPG